MVAYRQNDGRFTALVPLGTLNTEFSESSAEIFVTPDGLLELTFSSDREGQWRRIYQSRCTLQ